MKKTIEDIQWRAPWRSLNHPLDLPALQDQLKRELAERHPLWDRDAKVVGRRVDSDDVLVVCSDGGVATVHLDWATGPHRFPAEYPSVVWHKSLAEFQKVVDEDALEYGVDNE